MVDVFRLKCKIMKTSFKNSFVHCIDKLDFMKKLLFFLLFVPMVSLGQTGDVETYSKTGDAKANLKDHYGAISDYTKAIELDPGHGPSYYNRGLSKLNLNNNSGAISE